jgi:hypothetical protein
MTRHDEIVLVASMAATLLAGSYAGNTHSLETSAAHHWLPASDADAAVTQARAILKETQARATTEKGT